MITEPEVNSLEAIRSQFPIFRRTIYGHPLTYLDSAATCQKPKKVVDAIAHFYAYEYATVHRGAYRLCQEATAKYNAVRDKVACFIGAPSSDEIVFTRGTTEGINLVATSFIESFLNPKDEVVIFSSEHHSNIVPWQLAKKRFGIELKIVDVNEHGDIDLESFSQQLSSKTKLVAMAHVSNVTGATHPVRQIIALCRDKGIYSLIDAAQSVGHMPIDVRDLGCDFLVFSSHKMYGPTGLGVLFGKANLLDKMSPWQGGGDMIEEVGFQKTTFAKAPLKFEAGTPMIAQVIGLGAAIDFLKEIGMSTIAAQEQKLTRYLLQELKSFPQAQLVGEPKHRAGIVSFFLKGVHPLDIATLLDLQGIAVRSGHLCALPLIQAKTESNSAIRVSFGLYNSREDIDRLMKTLTQVFNRLDTGAKKRQRVQCADSLPDKRC